eukprot:1058094-Rhodomonas_salina.1
MTQSNLAENCCGCFSLTQGVYIVAGMDFLQGVLTVFLGLCVLTAPDSFQVSTPPWGGKRILKQTRADGRVCCSRGTHWRIISCTMKPQARATLPHASCARDEHDWRRLGLLRFVRHPGSEVRCVPISSAPLAVCPGQL